MFAFRSCLLFVAAGRCEAMQKPRSKLLGRISGDLGLPAVRAPPRVTKNFVVDMFGYLQKQSVGVPLLGGLSSTYAELTKKVDGRYQSIITNSFPPVLVHAALFHGVWQHGDRGEDDPEWLVWKGLHAQPDIVEKVHHITRCETIGSQINNAVTALDNKVDTEFLKMGSKDDVRTVSLIQNDPRKWVNFFGMQATCEGGPAALGVNVILGAKGKGTQHSGIRMSVSDYVPYSVFKELVMELLVCPRVRDVLIVWDSSFDGGVWVPFVENLADVHKDRVVLVHASDPNWDSAQWRQSITVQEQGIRFKRFITVQMSAVTSFVNNQAVYSHHRFEDDTPEELAICEAAFGVKTFADYRNKGMNRAKALEVVFAQNKMCATPRVAGNLNLELREFAMELQEYKIGGVVAAKDRNDRAMRRSAVEELFNLNVEELSGLIDRGLVTYPNSGTAMIDERRWDGSRGGWAPQWPENEPLMGYEGYGSFVLRLEDVRRRFGTEEECVQSIGSRFWFSKGA